MIRIVVVDDSPTYRMMLVEALTSDPEIEVVGTASSGEQAIELIRVLKPDLITMDVVMGKTDGLETTRRIMAIQPTPILIVTALTDTPELNLAFEAMKAGALDIIGKSNAMDDPGNSWIMNVVTMVKRLVKVDHIVTEETYDAGVADQAS